MAAVADGMRSVVVQEEAVVVDIRRLAFTAAVDASVQDLP